MSDAAPAIGAENVWVRYMIRYHRAEVTLRETLIRWFDRRRPKGHPTGRWRQAFWALQDVSLTAGAGDVIGVVGKNGSGKTTLLKTLSGICTPDRGHVEVRGKVGCLLSFGVGFNLSLSGRENIYLNGSLLGLKRREIDERLQDIIEFSELGEFIDAPVRTYSTGMRGRLGFSIAACIDADILLLDEALSTGDAGFRAKAGSILERFRNEKKIVVIASHNMPLIRQVCTRAIWVAQGKIVMQGDPTDVTRAYYTHQTEAKGSRASELAESATPASA